MSGWAAAVGGIVDLLGANEDRQFKQRNYNQSRTDAQYYARNSVQLRTLDAKDAGLHPLATLGANIPTPSPISVGGTNYAGAARSIGNRLQQAVQDRQANKESNARIKLLEKQADAIKVANDASRNAQEQNRNQHTTPYGTLDVDTSTDDARVSEDRYGEASDIFGIGNLLQDIGKTIANNQYKKRSHTLDYRFAMKQLFNTEAKKKKFLALPKAQRDKIRAQVNAQVKKWRK